MRKKIKSAAFLCLAAVILLSFSSCIPARKDIKTVISEYIEIDVSAGEVVTHWDTHGGFLGDGDTFAEIKLEDESIEDEIKENGNWKELPFSDNMTALLYGLVSENVHAGPYLDDENGDPFFPEIKNGYYFFYDRHSEASLSKRYDESEVFDRASFNFVTAIYDTDTGTLYYWKFDT